MNNVRILADSISPAGARITTMACTYWRAIHAEVMTHRAFSRNAASSRAIPNEKVLSAVRNNPAGPLVWGLNQPGMQAAHEIQQKDEAKATWVAAARAAADYSAHLASIGVHKQIANRITEPFAYITTVITATDWGNFFA